MGTVAGVWGHQRWLAAAKGKAVTVGPSAVQYEAPTKRTNQEREAVSNTHWADASRLPFSISPSHIPQPGSRQLSPLNYRIDVLLCNKTVKGRQRPSKAVKSATNVDQSGRERRPHGTFQKDASHTMCWGAARREKAREPGTGECDRYAPLDAYETEEPQRSQAAEQRK